MRLGKAQEKPQGPHSSRRGSEHGLLHVYIRSVKNMESRNQSMTSPRISHDGHLPSMFSCIKIQDLTYNLLKEQSNPGERENQRPETL